MSALETLPPALPLDDAPLLFVVWWMTDPLVQAWVAFSLLALTVAFVAALGFGRSIPKSRYRRTPHAAEGVDALPEIASAPYPNLLAK